MHTDSEPGRSNRDGGDIPRKGTPDGELPVVIAVNRVVHRENGNVAWISHYECSSSGLSIYLQARILNNRTNFEEVPREFNTLIPTSPEAQDALTLEAHFENERGQGGGMHRIEALRRAGTAGTSAGSTSWWIPLPARKSTVLLSIAWPEFGLSRTKLVIDGEDVRRGVESSMELSEPHS